MTKFTLMNMLFYSLTLFILFLLMMNHRSHPVLMMLMIISYNILLILNMSMWKMNFIYSIMMFLIMISGLLIIFLYFASLVANVKMSIKLNLTLFLMLTLNLIVMMITNPTNYPTMTCPQAPTKENLPINNINDKMFMNIIDLYTYPYNSVTILCMSYLLISLFSIIKLISMKSKPLRKV
uniref:NADH dehydrogenase subunit 6 n=1 Tax=Leptomyrmex pallens TaxID=611136 RepID=V5JF48_9HYME|nr:NADH dehydrogenase subunit 6 [Leptomyrmex pallens]AGL61401.1 NADH dehydrogenase subunit 6 [Leptomyrmex pallens]